MSFQVIHPKKLSQSITLFEIASQWSTTQAYWVTLALISNIANYLKYNYSWDCDGIDNVTLRLWKFSDFCSRHIVGVAGDDIMFHILVCVCLCLSRCLSGRFNYEGLVPHKQYFAGTLLEMSSCASYVSRTHDVIDDVTRWQSRSKFEIDISPSIFDLERRSKAQNIGNANAIFLTSQLPV